MLCFTGPDAADSMQFPHTTCSFPQGDITIFTVSGLLRGGSDTGIEPVFRVVYRRVTVQPWAGAEVVCGMFYASAVYSILVRKDTISGSAFIVGESWSESHMAPQNNTVSQKTEQYFTHFSSFSHRKLIAGFGRVWRGRFQFKRVGTR
jgi:hypothetical protein